MNNPHRLKLVSNERLARDFVCAERLEDFLEHLCAPLIGIVPYAERRAFREEAHTHLDGLIREYVRQGQGEQEATEAALREFGEPWKVGKAFLEEWQLGTPHLRPALLIRKATGTAFAWFGIASMLILLMLEQGLSSTARETLLPWMGLAAFLAPFVGGALTGAMCSGHVERGVRNAIGLLALHAAVVGLLLLPRYEGLAFAGWQLLFWMPAGCGSAVATASCLRQVRRQRFWQVTR